MKLIAEIEPLNENDLKWLTLRKLMIDISKRPKGFVLGMTLNSNTMTIELSNLLKFSFKNEVIFFQYKKTEKVTEVEFEYGRKFKSTAKADTASKKLTIDQFLIPRLPQKFISSYNWTEYTDAFNLKADDVIMNVETLVENSKNVTDRKATIKSPKDHYSIHESHDVTSSEYELRMNRVITRVVRNSDYVALSMQNNSSPIFHFYQEIHNSSGVTNLSLSVAGLTRKLCEIEITEGKICSGTSIPEQTEIMMTYGFEHDTLVIEYEMIEVESFLKSLHFFKENSIFDLDQHKGGKLEIQVKNSSVASSFKIYSRSEYYCENLLLNSSLTIKRSKDKLSTKFFVLSYPDYLNLTETFDLEKTGESISLRLETVLDSISQNCETTSQTPIFVKSDFVSLSKAKNSTYIKLSFEKEKKQLDFGEAIDPVNNYHDKMSISLSHGINLTSLESAVSPLNLTVTFKDRKMMLISGRKFTNEGWQYELDLTNNFVKTPRFFLRVSKINTLYDGLLQIGLSRYTSKLNINYRVVFLEIVRFLTRNGIFGDGAFST